jgi:hypothetical protein
MFQKESFFGFLLYEERECGVSASSLTEEVVQLATATFILMLQTCWDPRSG